MIQVIQLEDGKYALENAMTGMLLRGRNGNPKLYRTARGAHRARKRFIRRFNKSIERIRKNIAP